MSPRQVSGVEAGRMRGAHQSYEADGVDGPYRRAGVVGHKGLLGRLVVVHSQVNRGRFMTMFKSEI